MIDDAAAEENLAPSSTRRHGRFGRGYLSAVASTALCYGTLLVVTNLLEDPVATFALMSSPVMVCVIALALTIMAIVTAAAAIGPCLATLWFADISESKGPWLFILAGAATGYVLGPLFGALVPQIGAFTGPDDPIVFGDRLAAGLSSIGPMFAISGAVGGMVFWRIGRRP
jgi:hypothetical protein